jgi:hypothetical protein
MKIKIDAADKAFSQFVRLRDGECVRCHSKVKMNDKGLPVSHQASHFMGRGKESTRYELLNVDTLCTGCHMYFTANPSEHYMWQVERKGQKMIDRLILLSNTYKRKDRVLEAMFWKQELKRRGDVTL